MQSFLDESAFSSRQFRFWYLFGLVLSSTIILFANKKKNSLITEHTYSAPTKWMRGKGRITLQFGCCYNYAKVKSFHL
jgi:hypothetical protein